MINTLEEFENICEKDKNLIGSHYNPKKILSKYKFSLNMLLNIFASNYLIYSYEDYYYNNFNLEMIKKYQSHIDIDEYERMKKKLNDILELEKRSEFLTEIIEKNIDSISLISTWKYDIISDYLEKLENIKNEKFIDIIIQDYVNLLFSNNFSITNNFFENLDIFNLTKYDLLLKSKEIIKFIESPKYSKFLSN